MSKIGSQGLKAFAGDDEEDTEDSDVGKKATDVLDDCVKRLDTGEHDEHAEQAMRNFDPDEDEMPGTVQDASLWEEAVEAVDPQGEGQAKYDDPWGLVGEIYVTIGGTFGAPQDSEDEEPADEVDE